MPTTTRSSRTRRISADEPTDQTPPFDVDEEEKPAPRRRTRQAQTEVEEEEPAPTSRRSRREEVEEDAEDTPPARRASRKPGSSAAEESKPSRLRRPIRDEDEDLDEEGDDVEGSGEETAIPFTVGRAAIQAARQATSGGVRFVFLKDGEPQLVKFLDVEPWSYQQHWVTRSGKQSFPCSGPKCPLCAVGSKLSQRVVFSVVNLSLPGGPAAQALDLPISKADVLFSLDEDRKIGPLPKLWYSLSRTELAKPKGFEKYNYRFDPMKDRDVEEDEDFDIDLDEAEEFVAEAEAPTREEVHGKVTRRVLQDIADEAMAE